MYSPFTGESCRQKHFLPFPVQIVIFLVVIHDPRPSIGVGVEAQAVLVVQCFLCVDVCNAQRFQALLALIRLHGLHRRRAIDAVHLVLRQIAQIRQLLL